MESELSGLVGEAGFACIPSDDHVTTALWVFLNVRYFAPPQNQVQAYIMCTARGLCIAMKLQTF